MKDLHSNNVLLPGNHSGFRTRFHALLAAVTLLLAVVLFSPVTVQAVGEPAVAVEPAPANVMELSLDQLLDVKVDEVYGASKIEQKISRAPASVSIITRDEFQKQGYRTLADALRSVNGVFVTDDRNYSYVGVRGFIRPGDYNSRVLLLVDGHRINDNVYKQGLYGTEAFLDADNIERVEFIRGPSSSLYGDNAFFGVVNVITRRGASLNGLETTAEVGDRDTYKAGLRYGKKFSTGVELFLSGSLYDSAGDRRIYFPAYDSPGNNGGVAENSDGDRAYHFYGSLGWGDVTLSGGWSMRRKIIPTASFATVFNAGHEQTTDERAYVDLKFAHQFSENVDLIAHVAYDTASYCGIYPYDSTNTPPVRYDNIDVSDGKWVSADWQLNWRIADRHTVIVGGDYQEDLAVHQANYDDVPRVEYLNDNRKGRHAGMFVMGELSLRTNLVINAGARVDNYDTFGTTANPRVGIIFNPIPETTIKLLYGEAFRAPNAYELYYCYPGQSKPNPSLKPETIRTYELIWEQQLPAHLSFTAAGYYYQVQNLASQVIDSADGLTVFQNVDQASAKGIELTLEGRYPYGLVARVSYALQRAENNQSGQELSNSPEQMAKLNLILPIWGEKLYAGVDLQYYSGVRTVMGNDTSGIFLANLTLYSRPITDRLEISASIYNLFDERRGFSASSEHMQDTIPLPGRTFRVKLTYRF